MADTVENAAFCLPTTTHFLTDDDLLSFNTKPTTLLHHPTKPHYNNHHNHDDDDELLAELTRYLARSSLNHSQQGWGYSTSSKSTLTGSGPWSSSRSGFSNEGSPTGPSRIPSSSLTTTMNQNDAAFQLLYEAQLAPLKLNSLSSHHNTSVYSHFQAKRHGSSVWEQGRGERADCYCSHHQNSHRHHHRSYSGGVSGWCPQRRQACTQGMTAVFLDGSGSGGGGGGGGGGVKKQPSGTGVFIPRRADSGTHHNQSRTSTVTATTRKKSSGCSTVWLPARVIQALNLDVDELKNGGANYNNTPKQVLTDHEITVARRNAVMSMQRRNGGVEGRGTATATMVGHHVLGLPNDWAY